MSVSLGQTFQLIRQQRGGRQVGKHYDRPRVNYGDIWCNRCQKPCDFSDSAAHNAANSGRSRLYIRAECHGETADILMTFQQWGDNQGKRVVAFEGVALPEKKVKAFIQPTPPIISHPFLLMDAQG